MTTIDALVEKLRKNHGYALVKSRRSSTSIVRSDADLLASAGLAEYQPGEMSQQVAYYNFGRVRKVVTRYEPGICILRMSV